MRERTPAPRMSRWILVDSCGPGENRTPATRMQTGYTATMLRALDFIYQRCFYSINQFEDFYNEGEYGVKKIAQSISRGHYHGRK